MNDVTLLDPWFLPAVAAALVLALVLRALRPRAALPIASTSESAPSQSPG